MPKYVILILFTFSFKSIISQNNNIQEIISEAIKLSSTDNDVPLPLASTYLTGSLMYAHPTPENYGQYFDLSEQVQLIENGHHFLPNIGVQPYNYQDIYPNFQFPDCYYDALNLFKDWGIPITINMTQWEQVLYQDSYYENTYDGELIINTNKHPYCSIDTNSLDYISPYSNINAWYDVGSKWVNETPLEFIQDIYPNPPLVLFLSNNEARKLTPCIAEESNEYINEYGNMALTPIQKREIFNDKFKERYLEMQLGFKDNLNNIWKDNVKFIGYAVNSTGHFARWNDWAIYSSYFSNRVANEHQYWDGGSTVYYLNASDNNISDFWVYSPQVQNMNIKMILEDTRIDKPNYWHELSIWDGFETEINLNKRLWYQNQHNQQFTADRYKGYLQFGMWLSRPRVVREFRNWTHSQELVDPNYFNNLLDAVDIIYENDILKNFWRKGSLVKNINHEHPYQSAVPPDFTNRQRWYLLDTITSDGTNSGTLSGDYFEYIRVYSIARVIGDSPNREWLVYAYAPQGDEENVIISIPDSQSGNTVTQISVDVKQSGSFFLVDEECLNSYVGNITITQNVVSSDTDIQIAETIEASNTLEIGSYVRYTANDIKLTNGFFAKEGSDFKANYNDCETNQNINFQSNTNNIISSPCNGLTSDGLTENFRNSQQSLLFEESGLKKDSSFLSIYPNPVKENLKIIVNDFIKEDNISLKLINIHGVSIFESKLTSNVNIIDISSIQNGFYILKSNNSKGKESINKIIIKN